MFRYLLSILSLLIISPCVANIASSEYVNEMRDNVQAKIDKKADNANYTQNMVLQTDNSGNVVATTVGTDLFADGAIETIHLADGAVTNADLAGMIDITKLNLGTLPTSGKHMMIWNAESNEYVFERYDEGIVLPAGYTQLEYIESTGTQYIDTGITNSNKFVIDIKIKPSNSRCLIGYSTKQADYFGKDASGNYELGGGIFLSSPPYATDRHVVTFDISGTKAVLSVEGKSIERAKSTPAVNTFKTRISSEYGGNGIVLYKLIAYINNDLVGYFIPSRNSSGVIGMYDTVTKTFFTNSGTGSFIAGPEAE